MTRTLALAGCGCLQGSVWIAPFVPPAFDRHVAEEDPDCSQLLILLADSKGSRIDKKRVATAWDFDRIEERYRDATTVMDQFEAVANKGSRAELNGWVGEMRLAWRAILALDPLLPAELLPSGFAMKMKVEGDRLDERHFQRAEEIAAGESFEAVAERAFARKTIEAFLEVEK